MAQSLRLDATGTAQASGPGFCQGALLTAGDGADASAIVRDGGAAGKILFTLKTLAKTSQNFTPNAGISFTTDLHVTLAGAGAECVLLA